MERLQRSLIYARIDPGMTLDEIENVINEVVKRNAPLREPGGDQIVWLAIMRGYAGTHARISEPSSSIVYISVMPLDFSGYAHEYNYGGHVVFPTDSKLFEPVSGPQAQALQPYELFSGRA